MSPLSLPLSLICRRGARCLLRNLTDLLAQAAPVKSFVIGLPDHDVDLQSDRVAFLGATAAGNLTDVYRLPVMHVLVRHHWQAIAERPFLRLVWRHGIICTCIVIRVGGRLFVGSTPSHLIHVAAEALAEAVMLAEAAASLQRQVQTAAALGYSLFGQPGLPGVFAPVFLNGCTSPWSFLPSLQAHNHPFPLPLS